MPENNSKQILVMFLIIVFTITISLSCYMIFQNNGKMIVSLVLLIMWSPAIAAIITSLIFQRNLKGFGWKPGKIRFLLISYTIPLLSTFVAYLVIWLTGLGVFSMPDQNKFGKGISGMIGLENPSFPVALLLMLTLGLVISLVSALGEEIGWRGFMVSHLTKLVSPKKTALVVGTVWALYHYIGLLFLDYYSGSRLKSLFFFTVLAVSASIIMVWLRLKSGSLWTGAIFHASHNLAIQGIFPQFTQNTGNTDFFTGEFGLGLAVVYTIIALVLWKRFDKIEIPEKNL